MNKRTKSIEGLTEKKQRRFREAKKSFQKIEEEIAPFIKHRKAKEYSTDGEWCETSTLYS